MQTAQKTWIIVLIIGLFTPLCAHAYTILLDIDLDDDPGTINESTPADSATIRVVLQPTEPNEVVTEFTFTIGSRCYEIVPEMSTPMAHFNILDGMVDIPGLAGDYWGVLGDFCGGGSTSDYTYMYCDVFTTDGAYLLDAPVFLDAIHVEIDPEWNWLSDTMPVHAVTDPWITPDISSEVWLGVSWSELSGPWAGDADNSRGLAWADFNLDNYPDLYIANHGGSNRLFRNDEGIFVDVTEGPLGDAGLGLGAFWADASGSGDHDLYLINDGANVLVQNVGWGLDWVDATTGWLAGSDDTQGAGWADYDLDGGPDLYISNSSASNLLLHNQGGMDFLPVTPSEMAMILESRGVAWGDYDYDGDPDLYVTTAGEGNHLFRNDRDGDFTEVTSGDVNVQGDCRGCAWGDYDNDEDLDLYVTRHDGANVLLRNDGDDLFTDVTGEDPNGELGDAGPGLTAAWVDYDNDRHLDLYVVNDSAPNVLLRNHPGVVGNFVNETAPLLESAGPGGGAAWADFDQDGDLDVYLLADGQANRLVRNEVGNRKHWFQVNPQSGHWDVLQPSTMIGARVRVVAGGVVQIREVSGGDGYLAQNSLVVEFGLGAADVVDTLEVWFPGGGLFRATELAADQLIWCHSRPSAVPDAEDTPAYCRLYPCVPNPFNPFTSMMFTLSAPRQLDLTIHAVDGSCVRRFPTAHYEPGRHEVLWDGRDGAGRNLPSGVYISRLKARDFEASQRMTLVR